MATRPAQLPTFATDPLLTAGAQAGLATRLDPGAGVRAQGFYQDRKLPARAFSYLLGALGDWIGYLANIQILTFRYIAWNFFPALTYNPVIIWVSESQNNTGSWLVFGNYQSGATSTLYGGKAPTSLPTGALASVALPNLYSVAFCAVNTDGSVLLATGADITSGANYSVYRSLNHGVTWARVVILTGGASGAGCVGLTYNTASGNFVFVGDANWGDGRSVYTSTDGLTWTLRANPPGMSSAASARGLIASSSASELSIVSGASVNQLNVSSDGGVTWAAAYAAPVTGILSAAYTGQYGWILIGLSTGGIAKTQSLAAPVWTTSTPFGTLSGGSSKVGSVESDGVSRYVCPHRDDTVSPGPGVMVSDDGGVTWRFVRFHSAVTTDYIPVAVRWNGSAWAVLGCSVAFPTTNAFALWQSLAL